MLEGRFTVDLESLLFDMTDASDVALLECALSALLKLEREKMSESINAAYEAYQLTLDCAFCQGGPLECDCEDVCMEPSLEETLDEALVSTQRSFEAVTKLGRTQTEQLLKELSLDANDEASWKTIESMTMWL